MKRWLPWLGLLVVVAVAVAIGASGSAAPTPAQRATKIASEVRCPTCAGQSADVSDAPAAKAVRTFIASEVVAGRTNGQVEAELRDRYGTDITLVPPATGWDSLVWALPVVALVVAIGGLAFAFRRWRSMTSTEVSDADRARVAAALGDGGTPDGSGQG